jgi:hypothetical protein
VARGGRPLPEREGSSLPPLSPPPQAANKDFATTLGRERIDVDTGIARV